MPSLLHEVLADIVREHPYVAALLVERLTGLPLSTMDARKSDANWSDLKPPELRADLVLELRERGEEEPSLALIVEVQLRRDERKRWAWPAYLGGLRRRLQCSTLLVVLTPDAAVGAWASLPIALDGLGLSMVQPVVLGPATIPEVTRHADVAARPELAVLSAIAHGEGPRAVSIARAAMRGFADLDDERGRLYADLVFLHLSEAAQGKLEELMDIEQYDLQSDIAKKLVARGQAQGKAEGKVEAVLLVLSGRGLAVPEGLGDALARLSAEDLDEALRRSAVVEAADALLER